MKKKIGVYVCHCGGNISDHVDIEKVKAAVRDEADVYLVKNTLFACADSSQKEIGSDIENEHLDAIVVASCSPKLHLNTFRGVAQRAGLNPYNYVQVNIREQSSWAHSDNKTGATEKAILLVKAGIAKAKESEALQSLKIPAANVVAVIGAGVGGMKTAIGLADMGTEVYLIEKDFFVGGRTPQWGTVSPNGDEGAILTEKLYKEVVRRPNITLFTGAELVEKSGSIGNFDLKIAVRPRSVSGNPTAEAMQRAAEVCPVAVKDDFNFGLTNRKAFMLPAQGQFPQTPAIDVAACTRCGECTAACHEVDLAQEEQTITLHVGAFVVNTGFDPYQPAQGEYGYGELDNVITLPQFRRLMELNENELIFNGKKIKKIAYIYCVGSRQDDDEGNTYCSRYCCTATSLTAVLAKKKFGNIINFHFNRGIRTYGKHELVYEAASKQGDIFLQFSLKSIPQIEKRGNKTYVKVKDILTAGKELETEADLIVLVTGMVPRKNELLEQQLKIPTGRDHFFNEIHMKLRPVETVIDGVLIAGTCQSPKNILETVNSSMAAAAKINSVLTKGELSLEPTLAKVNPAACDWCDNCSKACPFDAILQTEINGKKVARVNEANCKGCGMCTPVCPTDAIDLAGYTNAQIESMIDALAEA
ncbi:CoB--CoM heterodisulfide reductase iron-sulfur subunit A family protein [Paludibacter jiangxiensis]|uniref:Heterodisulfide reductase subunit A n=1 Tax=Paludibacter jiangxiensis TaxID=681398 RepID=A0A170ZHL7_9BACT|nr:CoB--CoM heterodisulfide reductase iron-sulfur subunit A family protein [Paludibacter jiangxiensis]GAT62676.1 heterodisulfide reductase subunit A [Paludibacter jiangxiensis]